MLMYALNRHRSGSRGLQPKKEEIERLVASLSPKAQDILKKTGTPDEKEKKLQVWIRAALFARMAPQVSNEKLLRFFETLDGSRRERLEGLPKEEMLRDLRRMYYSEMFRKRRNPFGSPFGSRPRVDDRGPPRFPPPRGENGPRGSGLRGENGPRGSRLHDENGLRKFDEPARRKRPNGNLPPNTPPKPFEKKPTPNPS